MRRSTSRWLPGMLLAVLLVMGTGTAAAAPPAEKGDTGLGYATALLYGTDPASGGGVESLFTVYAPAGVSPFGRGEVFLGGYECLTEDSVPARVTRLHSAGATGWLAYDCTSEAGTVRGYAVVHLHWTGHGETTVQSWTDEAGCVITLQVRPARVSGGMVVLVPGVGSAVLTLNAEDDADIRQERTDC